MRRFVIGLTLFVMAAGLACNPASPVLDPAPAPSHPAHPAQPAQQSQPSHPSQPALPKWPTKDEVLAYLDGKTVSLSDPNKPAGQDNKPHVLKRDQIDVLEVDQAGSRADGDAGWSTEVNFIVNTGEARYAIVVWIEHKVIETKRAFYGFQVKKVSRQ